MSAPSLPAGFVALRPQRLALGLEPIDVMRRRRVATSLRVTTDAIPGNEEPIARHASCVHALLQRPGLPSPLDVRLDDPTRRFVPRRLRVELAPPAARALSPALYPGAAYDVASRATGVRGHVTRGGAPLRWARIEARVPGSGAVVGRAHGDDRGEFLLLIDAEAASIGDLPPTISLEVFVFGPLPNPPMPPPAHPDLPALDPLWDLPLETVPTVGPDDVTSGITVPPGYGFTSTSHPTIAFELGRLRSAPPVIFS